MMIKKKIAKDTDMKSKIVQFIDSVILTVVGAFCFTYIMPGGHLFAETHVQFSFLNFPVFIGEFLLAGCIILTLIKFSFTKIELNKWHYLIIFYFSFVLLKAWWGYVHWGPLALRDAALFYYLAFAVIAYYAYRPDYFTRFTILVCYVLLIMMFFNPVFNDFWLLGRLCFGLILAYRYPQRWVGILMAVGILIFTPYNYFTETARTILLGNYIAISFLVLSLVFFMNRKARLKILVSGVVAVVVLGLYVFHFSGSRPAQTIFNWPKLSAMFRELDDDIQRQKPNFKRMVISHVRIYNPDIQKPLNTGLKNIIIRST